MEKIITIKNCLECNNSHMSIFSSGAFLTCTKTLALCPDEEIPNWCPLHSLGDDLKNTGIYIAGWND